MGPPPPPRNGDQAGVGALQGVQQRAARLRGVVGPKRSTPSRSERASGCWSSWVSAWAASAARGRSWTSRRRGCSPWTARPVVTSVTTSSAARPTASLRNRRLRRPRLELARPVWRLASGIRVPAVELVGLLVPPLAHRPPPSSAVQRAWVTRQCGPLAGVLRELSMDAKPLAAVLDPRRMVGRRRSALVGQIDLLVLASSPLRVRGAGRQVSQVASNRAGSSVVAAARRRAAGVGCVAPSPSCTRRRQMRRRSPAGRRRAGRARRRPWWRGRRPGRCVRRAERVVGGAREQPASPVLPQSTSSPGAAAARPARRPHRQGGAPPGLVQGGRRRRRRAAPAPVVRCAPRRRDLDPLLRVTGPQVAGHQLRDRSPPAWSRPTTQRSTSWRSAAPTRTRPVRRTVPARRPPRAGRPPAVPAERTGCSASSASTVVERRRAGTTAGRRARPPALATAPAGSHSSAPASVAVLLRSSGSRPAATRVTCRSRKGRPPGGKPLISEPRRNRPPSASRPWKKRASPSAEGNIPGRGRPAPSSAGRTGWPVAPVGGGLGLPAGLVVQSSRTRKSTRRGIRHGSSSNGTSRLSPSAHGGVGGKQFAKTDQSSARYASMRTIRVKQLPRTARSNSATAGAPGRKPSW